MFLGVMLILNVILIVISSLEFAKFYRRNLLLISIHLRSEVINLKLIVALRKCTCLWLHVANSSRRTNQ